MLIHVVWCLSCCLCGISLQGLAASQDRPRNVLEMMREWKNELSDNSEDGNGEDIPDGHSQQNGIPCTQVRMGGNRIIKRPLLTLYILVMAMSVVN